MQIDLRLAATANTTAPSLITDGVQIRQKGYSSTARGLQGQGRAAVLVKSTAGSGTMTVTVLLWGYYPGKPEDSQAAAGWYPLGTATTATNKGKLNDGSAMGETTADLIRHVEMIENLAMFTRMDAQILDIGGTATAVNVHLIGAE